MKIVTATIIHECNVFLPLRADLDHFRRTSLYYDEKVLTGRESRGTNTFGGGFIEGSERFGFEIIPTVYARAGAFGVITKKAYDYILDNILSRIRNIDNYDGVLLCTHGAGYTEEHPDLEGHYFRELRKVVGPDKPIVTVLDLHANHTEEWEKYIDIFVGNDTYPHIDSYDRGLEAANLLVRMINGEIKPTRAFVKVPMILTAQAQYTGRYPLTELFDLVHKFEEHNEVLTITVAGGFPWCDVPTPWPTITVTTDNNPKLAQDIAEKLKEFIWSHRMNFLVEPMSVRKAVYEAMNSVKGPYVLADIANNPGWGAASDGTVLLKALIEMGATNTVVGAFWDRDGKAVNKAIKAGIGNNVTLTVGGKVDTLHGQPIEISCKVKLISDGQWIAAGPMHTGIRQNNGKTIILDINGILLVMTEKRVQARDLNFYRSLGIEPTKKQILCVNSSVHFRAALSPIAEKIIEVDTPGIASPRLLGYPWKNLERPIFPLDPETFDIIEWKSMEE